MTVTGESQGKIIGSSNVTGVDDGTIEFFSFEHAVEMSRNKETGLPVGRRVHLDISIKKEIDKSTPKLHKALCDSERLTEVLFLWYRPSGNSKTRENFFSIRLENALITRIQLDAPDRIDSCSQNLFFFENISFAYEKITWTWEDDGSSHFDSWLSPE